MNSLKTILAKYTSFFKTALAWAGPWGPLLISTVDSAAFGIPLDPVMIGYAIKYKDSVWMVVLCCLMAGVGSAIGSLVPYWIGRRGGEPLLLKKISHERLEELRDRYEKWEVLSLAIPSMLPPPTPMKLIVLAAGAFEMRIPLFMGAIFVGRLVRFGLLSWMVIRYGEKFMEVVKSLFHEHLGLMIWSVVGLIVLSLGIWWYVRSRKPAIEA
ncbi:MAG TPA: VTT domain-containing protein [Terriglobales bacterium]|nr:VTT domain-containing protein [Terriglobales bacterium]